MLESKQTYMIWDVECKQYCYTLLECVCTSYTTVIRAVWDIHRGQEVIRARGRSPRALITSCPRCISYSLDYRGITGL